MIKNTFSHKLLVVVWICEVFSFVKIDKNLCFSRRIFFLYGAFNFCVELCKSKHLIKFTFRYLFKI